MIDVVFALVIWRLFTILPKPVSGDGGAESLFAFVGDNLGDFVGLLLGAAIVIVYWGQNNAALGNLVKTDWVHSALSVFLLIALLLFLYLLAAGIAFGAGPQQRVLESGSATMAGVMGYAAWWYALRRSHLVSPALQHEDQERLLSKNTAEPLTAVLTIPLAFAGPWAWELSWFLYPGIRWLINRRAKAPSA